MPIKIKTYNKEYYLNQEIARLKQEVEQYKGLSLPDIDFSEWSDPVEYIDPLATLKSDPVDNRDFILQAASSKKLPISIDWTSRMSSVKDQGNLGSCVAFAVVAVKEYQEYIEKTKKVGPRKASSVREYNLSEQWVYYKCKAIDPWPNEEGTSIRYAMKILQSVGVPLEIEWKYSDRSVGRPLPSATKTAKWCVIGSYWRINNLSQLKTALSSGPVIIGIECFEEIFRANRGVIPYPRYPNRSYGGHAICAVGYNDKAQRIKFKNSWSRWWGDRGYGYLPYKYINNFMIDAWAAKDVVVKGSKL